MHKNQLCNTSQLLRRNLIPSVPQRGSSVVLFHQFALVYCKSGERGGIGSRNANMHVRAGCDSVLHTSSNHVFWQIRLQILANNIYMYQITRHCQQVCNELDRNISHNSQEQLLSGTRAIRSSLEENVK